MYQTRQAERRRSRRVKMKQGLRVRPSSPTDAAFEEIGITTNVSQDGVYFLTQRSNYYEGMRLFVTVPYHSPSSPQNYDYLGQIARIDDVGNGQRGIAVRLLSAANKTFR
jgi:PilZ domain